MPLLDTNTCIYYLQGSHPSLQHRIANARDLAISSITLAELSVGASNIAERERQSRLLRSFLRAIRVEDFNAAAAGRYGRLVREAGFRRHDFDRLIAAHALTLDEILVTSNERHFANIPGLKIENWTLPQGMVQ